MLSQDFKEFIQLLNENQIEYLVVGGYAVGVHGYPRYTGDIDIWINMSDENAEKIISVLDKFGFGELGFKKKDFLNADNVIQLGVPPFRIDILMALDGVNFHECYPNKHVVNVDGDLINFISFEDLIKNKKTIGRERDIIDLENLKKPKTKFRKSF